jgi:hypothetical protein
MEYRGMTSSAIIELPSSLFVCPFICTTEYDDGLTGISALYSDIQLAFSFTDTMEFMVAAQAIRNSLHRKYSADLRLNSYLEKLVTKAIQDQYYGDEMAIWLLKLHTRVGYGKNLFQPGVFLLLNEDYSSTGATIVPRPTRSLL